MDRPDPPRQVPMAAPSIPWHVCDDCLEPLAKRIASQAAGVPTPGRIDVAPLLRRFKFRRATTVLQCAVGVPLAKELEARVVALQDAIRSQDDAAYQCYLEEHGPLPDDCPKEHRDAIRKHAAWKAANYRWTHLDEEHSQAVKTTAENYQKLQRQAAELAEYLLDVSNTVRVQVDAFTMNTPATTLQTCLHRLQHLQTWFQHLESSQELVDAMQEGGHVLAVIVRDQHLPAEELLPNGAEIVADYVSQALADRRKANPMETEGMAKFTQRALWELVALEGTDRQRLLMHPPTELAAGILAQSTDYKSNYRRQGMQFSLLAGQILEKLEAVAAAAQQASSSKKPSNTESKENFTEGDLVDALDKLLTKSDKFYTQQEAADELKRRYPEKTIGKSKVGAHRLWKKHAEEWGRNRAPRNTSRQAKESAIKKMAGQQERNEAADAGKTIRGNRINDTDR